MSKKRPTKITPEMQALASRCDELEAEKVALMRRIEDLDGIIKQLETDKSYYMKLATERAEQREMLAKNLSSMRAELGEAQRRMRLIRVGLGIEPEREEREEREDDL